MWRILKPLARLIGQRKELLAMKRNRVEKEAKLSSATEELSQLEKNFNSSKEVLTRTEHKLQSANKELEELKIKIVAIKSQEVVDKLSYENFSALKQKAETEVHTRTAERDDALEKVTSSTNEISKTITNDFTGPEKKTPELNKNDDATNSHRIHALGDLHGWAPGLISYLTHHNLAKIEISGLKVYKDSSKGKISIDIDVMCNLFPDLVEHFAEQKRNKAENDFSIESFMHAGLLGQRAGTQNHKASYCDIQAEWIGKGEYFIQVGDVFDRADHSELAAEILRQLLIQAPAHIFVLVGNHEEFLLLDQYDSWLRNEKKWHYDSKSGGNTRTLSLINTPYTDDELLRDTYDKYQQSASMLYLTQFFAKREVTKSSLVGSGPDFDEEIESFSERILSGGWSGYESAFELHQIILKRSIHTPTKYPGAIAGLGIGNTWFQHGEPNGLKKYFSSLDTTSVEQFKNPVTIGGREMLMLEMSVMTNDEGGYKSDCTEIFWARDAHSGFDSLDSKFAHIVDSIVHILPGVRNIVHGHSPVPNFLSENQPHTYLGRLVSKDVTPEYGEVRVYNIDEGMTPVYQPIMDNKTTLECFPTGLQVPNALKKYHDSGAIISSDDLWDLSHMYIEKDHLPYTITHELTLNEVPAQYLKSGAGHLKVNRENFKEPEFICTSEDDFRKDPSKFSWMHLLKSDQLSNPNKERKPPRDELYRLQHSEHGTLTLAENVLKMLELESFEDTSDSSKFEAYSGDRSKIYLKGIRTDKYFTPEMEDYGVLSDARNCSVQFLNICSTNSPNHLILSFLNMSEKAVKLLIEQNHLDAKSSEVKAESCNIYSIEPGNYLTSPLKIFPESPVQISIEELNGAKRECFQAIFGEGTSEILSIAEEKPPKILLSIPNEVIEELPPVELKNTSHKDNSKVESENLLELTTEKEEPSPRTTSTVSNVQTKLPDTTTSNLPNQNPVEDVKSGEVESQDSGPGITIINESETFLPVKTGKKSTDDEAKMKEIDKNITSAFANPTDNHNTDTAIGPINDQEDDDTGADVQEVKSMTKFLQNKRKDDSSDPDEDSIDTSKS